MTDLSFQQHYLYKIFSLKISARSALQEYLQARNIYLYTEETNGVNDTDVSYFIAKGRADTAIAEQKVSASLWKHTFLKLMCKENPKYCLRQPGSIYPLPVS